MGWRSLHHLQRTPNCFSERLKDLGSFSTFEYLAGYFTFRDLHSLIIVIYRPGSESINLDFFTEFANLLAAISKFSCHIIILGDLNIHLDEINDCNTKRINKLIATHELIQHVTVPTQIQGHTLDFIITRDDKLAVNTIDVAPPSVSGNARALWKSLNTFLNPPPDTFLRISPDTLLDYFENKAKAIRESTKDAPVPDFSTLLPPVHLLCKFDEVTTAEVERLLSDLSTTQCELDSAPVWLLTCKSLCMGFAPFLALLINVSIVQASLPAKHKRAIIRPRVKKPGLDPDRSGQLSSNFKLVLHFKTR